MLHILLFVQSQLRAIAVSNLANYHNYQIAIGVSCINLGIKSALLAPRIIALTLEVIIDEVKVFMSGIVITTLSWASGK